MLMMTPLEIKIRFSSKFPIQDFVVATIAHKVHRKLNFDLHRKFFVFFIYQNSKFKI